MVVLSCVSFLNELSSQSVAPLIPLLLATTLGAGPIALGLIEGLAEAVSNLLKLWSGRRSDVLGKKRRNLIVGGYGLSVIARPLIGFAVNWPVVLLLRSLDRAGKGLRGAPRDALLTDAAPEELRGRAFGFNRAFDYAGAVGGSLLAAAALTFVSDSISTVILLSAIPGVCAVALLASLVKDIPALPGTPKAKTVPSVKWTALSPAARRFFPMLMIFSLSRVAESFILLRAHDLGMPTVTVLLFWALICALQSVVSLFGGGLSDRFSKATVVTVTWFADAIALLVIALAQGDMGLWVSACGYAMLTGIGEGAEKAYISEISTDADRGTAFGWYNMIVGFAAIPAGLAFGLLWTRSSAALAFGIFGSAGLLSAVVVWWWQNRRSAID